MGRGGDASANRWNPLVIAEEDEDTVAIDRGREQRTKTSFCEGSVETSAGTDENADYWESRAVLPTIEEEMEDIHGQEVPCERQQPQTTARSGIGVRQQDVAGCFRRVVAATMFTEHVFRMHYNRIVLVTALVHALLPSPSAAVALHVADPISHAHGHAGVQSPMQDWERSSVMAVGIAHTKTWRAQEQDIPRAPDTPRSFWDVRQNWIVCAPCCPAVPSAAPAPQSSSRVARRWLSITPLRRGSLGIWRASTPFRLRSAAQKPPVVADDGVQNALVLLPWASTTPTRVLKDVSAATLGTDFSACRCHRVHWK